MTTAQTTRTQFSDVFPPPFHADDGNVYGISHGKRVRIATVATGRFTDEGRAMLAWDIADACTKHDALLADRDRLRAALESAVLKIEDIFAQKDCSGSYCETFRRGHGEHREFCELARAALAQSDKGE